MIILGCEEEGVWSLS